MRFARPLTLVALLGLLTAFALSGATVVQAKSSKKKSKCQRLKGKDRAPARKVKLVKHRNADGAIDLVGCVLPRGPIYTVGSGTDDEVETNSYSLVKVKSSTVIVTSTSSNQAASSSSDELVSLRTGERAILSTSCSSGLDACGSFGGTYAPVVRINKHGRAVVLQVSGTPSVSTLFSFSSRGARQDLDSGPIDAIPAAAVTLTGDVVSWTHSGQARTALLSG